MGMWELPVGLLPWHLSHTPCRVTHACMLPSYTAQLVTPTFGATALARPHFPVSRYHDNRCECRGTLTDAHLATCSAFTSH
eukprot:364973-Chlamydomonas_euryale.AAC.15